MKRSVEERPGFLDESCGGDTELLREVESLLEQHFGGPGLEADALLGQQVATYRIVSLLGTGGMGRVYLAQDSNLRRQVALKFLPPELQAHETARRRFHREARSAAAIDHPYICSIYEVGTADGRDFIAMEHVEGQTLADRLAEGPLPINEALTTALEIAEAVEAAHAAGIVHRDLKPSNVMLTTAGHAKVMDFGLAKRLTRQEAAHSDSPDDLTTEGTTPGTIAYMSPEQLNGDEVDERSDVFSFGVMLFEMLTGVHPFRRSVVAGTTAAILKDPPPPLARFLPEASDAVGHVVRKMLAKEPGRRYQSMHEVRTELLQLLEDPERFSHERSPKALNWQVTLPWALLTLMFVLVWVVPGWIIEPPTLGLNDSKLTFQVPEGTRFTHGGRHGLSMSPDGTRIAFAAGVAQDLTPRPLSSQIYIRHLNQWDAQLVPGSDGGFDPVFSPSGQSLAFYRLIPGQLGQLKTVVLDGSDPVTLCECEIARGFAWESEASIVGAPWNGPLFRVSATGSREPLQEITELHDDEQSHLMPHFLPGGEELLFTAVPFGLEGWPEDWSKASIVWKSLKTGEREVLIENATDARYVPTGHLVFAREGRLMAVELDRANRKVIGSPVQILDGVNHSRRRAAQFTFSTSGVLVYASGSVPPADRSHIVRVDPTTGDQTRLNVPVEVGVESLAGEGLAYSSLQVSRDGKSLLLVFSRWGYNGVYVYEIETGSLEQQTFEGEGDVTFAIWGPRPEQFTFDSHSEGVFELRVKRLNLGRRGSSERLETGVDLPQFPGAWSSDGQFLIFIVANPDNVRGEPNRRRGGFDFWKLPSGGKAEPLLAAGKSAANPALSHDDNWLAFSHAGLRLCALPLCDKQWSVTARPGIQPYWTRDDRQLFFRDHPGSSSWPLGPVMQRFFRVPVNRGQPEPAEVSELPFKGDWSNIGWPLHYGGFDADGNLILLQRSNDNFDELVEELYPTELHVVTNWFDELRRLVPVSP